VRTYLIRGRLFRPGEDCDIADQARQPALHVDAALLSLRHRLIPRDPAGQVRRKLAALRSAYEITVGGTDVAEARKHLLTPSANGSSQPRWMLESRCGLQEAASHPDPGATMRYDRAWTSLDRHATCIVAAYVAGTAR
jgi:hypothetical protein